MSAPQKKPDNTGWYVWPLIIVLFGLGLWPVALVLLFLTIFGDEKRKKQPTSQRKPSAEERVERAVEEAVDRAMAKAREAGSRAAASRRAAAPSEVDRAVADVERAAEDLAKEFAANERKAAAPKKPAKKKKKSKKKEPEKLPGKLLRVIGLCLLALGAVVSVDAAAEILQGWTFYLEDLFTGFGFAAAGGIMWGRGQYLARMARRTSRYVGAIGEAEAMPLSEIAKRVNRSEKETDRELQKLIDKGYLGDDAYIDHERGYFLRFGATVEEEPEEAAPPPPKEAEEGYSGILRDFRRVNDRIADEVLSQKIDRLEQVSALIFKEVEEHPEKRSRIRTFFDYYLPTTQKLLEAYAEFEETGVEGEHLGQAKDRIEETMDAIVEGFEHQLDQLYSADALDVFSDIKVMETMLHRDTASAAKDFGYAEQPKVQPKTDSRPAASSAAAAQSAPEAGPEEDGGVSLKL